MSFQLKIYPYNGCSCILMEGSKEECRARAARKIRYHRNKLEYPVAVLDRGERWELESDPEGCSMIGDSEGILALKEMEEPELEDEDWDEELVQCCMECGNQIADPGVHLCEECQEMSDGEDSEEEDADE